MFATLRRGRHRERVGVAAQVRRSEEVARHRVRCQRRGRLVVEDHEVVRQHVVSDGVTHQGHLLATRADQEHVEVAGAAVVDVVQVHVDVRDDARVRDLQGRGVRDGRRIVVDDEQARPDVDRVGDGDARARRDGRADRRGRCRPGTDETQTEAQPQAEREDGRENGRR